MLNTNLYLYTCDLACLVYFIIHSAAYYNKFMYMCMYSYSLGVYELKIKVVFVEQAVKMIDNAVLLRYWDI